MMKVCQDTNLLVVVIAGFKAKLFIQLGYLH